MIISHVPMCNNDINLSPLLFPMKEHINVYFLIFYAFPGARKWNHHSWCIICHVFFFNLYITGCFFFFFSEISQWNHSSFCMCVFISRITLGHPNWYMIRQIFFYQCHWNYPNWHSTWCVFFSRSKRLKSSWLSEKPSRLPTRSPWRKHRRTPALSPRVSPVAGRSPWILHQWMMWRVQHEDPDMIMVSRGKCNVVPL